MCLILLTLSKVPCHQGLGRICYVTTSGVTMYLNQYCESVRIVEGPSILLVFGGHLPTNSKMRIRKMTIIEISRLVLSMPCIYM